MCTFYSCYFFLYIFFFPTNLFFDLSFSLFFSFFFFLFLLPPLLFFFFFFNDPATPEIYPFSLPDSFPIFNSMCSTSRSAASSIWRMSPDRSTATSATPSAAQPPSCHLSGSPLIHNITWTPLVPCSAADRKSTRLNSSHLVISYAVFCLQKK